MALEQTSLGTGIRYEDIQALNMYWSQVRMLYTCFEANVRASDSSVFDHEMPGGQYTNLMVCVKGWDFRPHLMSCSLVPSITTRPGNTMGGYVVSYLTWITLSTERIYCSYQAEIYRSERPCEFTFRTGITY